MQQADPLGAQPGPKLSSQVQARGNDLVKSPIYDVTVILAYQWIRHKSGTALFFPSRLLHWSTEGRRKSFDIGLACWLIWQGRPERTCEMFHVQHSMNSFVKNWFCRWASSWGRVDKDSAGRRWRYALSSRSQWLERQPFTIASAQQRSRLGSEHNPWGTEYKLIRYLFI